MSQFTNRDQRLLSEAYSTQLLKESFPGMTLSQAGANINLLSESEAEYVCEVSERILNEFFGGMKGLLGGAKNDAGNAGRAINGAGNRAGGAISGALGRAGGAIKGAAQAGVDKAKQVGGGIANAASQIGDNAKTMYNTASSQAGAESFAKKAMDYVEALKDELAKAQQEGMITFKGNIDQIPLGEIVDQLMLSAKGHGNLARSAQGRGFTKGVGGAFKQGMQS